VYLGYILISQNYKKKSTKPQKFIPLRLAGRPIAQEIGRKVRAGQSNALWKAQIGEEFMQG